MSRRRAGPSGPAQAEPKGSALRVDSREPRFRTASRLSLQLIGDHGTAGPRRRGLRGRIRLERERLGRGRRDCRFVRRLLGRVLQDLPGPAGAPHRAPPARRIARRPLLGEVRGRLRPRLVGARQRRPSRDLRPLSHAPFGLLAPGVRRQPGHRHHRPPGDPGLGGLRRGRPQRRGRGRVRFRA